MIAVIASVIQNAFQTPTAPKNLLSKNAAGMMTTTYRQREISKEGVPFPSPSNAPEDVTETAETINPAPMMRKARRQRQMCIRDRVNSPINCPGISRHITVPNTIMIPLMHKTILKIWLTRWCSPAP